MNSIVLAPFSNSGIRDWPSTAYAALIGVLLDRLGDDAIFKVIGTANQRLRANGVVRRFPAGRVLNECGRMPWAETVGELRQAACVIGNNSGIAHLGGMFGVPTVCVFGASHQRQEWRALGSSVVVITRALGCSPCHRDHGQVSPYDKACLREIEPKIVADAAVAIMRKVSGRSG